MAQQAHCLEYHFRGHHAYALTASGVGSPWTTADTSSAGSPTLIGVNGGGFQLKFSATSEVQNLCLYFGDKLAFDIDELIRFECIVKTVATLDAATSLAFGMTSARNDTIDTIAEAALFRCIANNNIVVETDDGTENNDDVSTGLTLGTDYKRFAIDFATGIFTKDPPSLSAGGSADVQFYASNSVGSLRRVASGTRFDMSNYTAGLQPFFQIQKTADTNVDSLDILYVRVDFKMPDYA